MFDTRELKLMFLDPTDLIINNINEYLSRNKALKLIFLRDNFPIFLLKRLFFCSYFYIFKDSLLVLTE